MHKVIKILGKSVLILILFVLFSPFVLSLLLAIPGVQNYVADQAARFASRHLQTTVDIGYIDIGAGGRILLDDFYVEDYQQDTLLYAKRLDLFFPNYGIDGQGLNFARTVLSGAKLYLRETEEGEMNIRQVVKRMSNPNREKKGNLHLVMNNLQIEDMTLWIERREHRNPEYGIDYGNMRFEHLTGQFRDFRIMQNGTGPGALVILADVLGLSFNEQSGFRLDQIAGHFSLLNGSVGFENLHLQMPHSDLYVPRLVLSGGEGGWQAYKNFITDVRMEVEFAQWDDKHDGYLSTDDVAYFAPSMRRWQTTFKRPQLEFDGTVSDFHVNITMLGVGAHTGIVAPTVRVQGLPEFSTARYAMTVTTFLTRAEDLIDLARKIGGRELPLTTRRLLYRMGNMGISRVRFDGSLSEFESQLYLHRSNVGRVRARATMKPLRQASVDTDDAQPYRSLTASLASDRIEVGRLLGKEPKLGSAAVSAQLSGVVEHRLHAAQLHLNVTDLQFNGYQYDSLHLDGNLRQRGIRGALSIVDPHIRTRIDGEVNWIDSLPRYDVTGRVNHLDLKRLNFNRRDSLAQFSGRFMAKASGRSLDDLNGLIQLQDVEYRYNGKVIESNRISLTGTNSATNKHIDLHSDFLDATFTSRSSYRVVYDYLRRSAHRYLPLVHRGEEELPPLAQSAASANDYSMLKVTVRDFEQVADAISEGLNIHENSTLTLMFNPVSDRLSLQLNSDYIQHGSNALITRLHLNASNEQDSLTMRGGAGLLAYKGLRLPHFTLSAGAKSGNVHLVTGFNNTEKEISAEVDLAARVTRPLGSKMPHVDLNLHHSFLTRQDQTWEMTGRNISLDSTRLEIGRFLIRNNEQRLLVDGVASRNVSDTLHLHLDNFEIAPILAFSDQLGYNIGGRMEGDAMMTAVMGNGVLNAEIDVEELSANELAAPPLRLKVDWDVVRNRADVEIRNKTKRTPLVKGFYAPRTNHYEAQLTIDSLDMALLDPMLDGVISSTRGVAAIDLTVKGTGAEPDIDGVMRVRDFGTTVDYTKVRYTLPEATIRVDESLFRSDDNLPVYDSEGNRGRLSLGLDLQHLANIGYHLRLLPDQMLVLNTDEEDNTMFHGHVYATGSAEIRGSKGEITMDISGTTDEHSLFFMPLAASNTISRAEFVSFVEPEVDQKTDHITEVERNFEQQRQTDRERASSSRMKINVELTVNPNVELQMNVADSPIKARGEGTLNMEIDPKVGKFNLLGAYSITEGTYDFSLQNLVSKSFVIENGSTIQWQGDPMDASLNIEAVYTVKTSLQPLLEGMAENIPVDRSTPVECRIHLSEHLTNPTIEFDVVVPDADPETSAVIATVLNSPEAKDMQFLYLFVMGSFMAENSLTASANNPGATASAATGVQFLANQLSRLLSVSDYNVVIRYRPKTEVASDELDLGLSKSLINNRLLVEVEGNYLLDDKQTANSSMSNFMGEAYVTYLIDRSGALRLRVFTQTIDRFDENQGLQETGVGVYYKEDFENLRDLRHRIKDRFTSKRRRERRAEREREKQAAAMRIEQSQQPTPNETNNEE